MSVVWGASNQSPSFLSMFVILDCYSVIRILFVYNWVCATFFGPHFSSPRRLNVCTFCADLSAEIIVLLLSMAASVFTVVGGVGGGLYVAYFACTSVVAIALFYFLDAFYLRGDSSTHSWGFSYDKPITDSVCDIIRCGRVPKKAGNLEGSTLTFTSMNGVFATALTVLSSFLPHTVYRETQKKYYRPLPNYQDTIL